MKYLVSLLIIIFPVCVLSSPSWKACPNSTLSNERCDAICSQLVAPERCKNTIDQCKPGATCVHRTVPTWPTMRSNADFKKPNKDWHKTALGKQYLSDVYGYQANDVDPNQITYFYPHFPYEVAMGVSFPKAAYYINGVPVDKLWIPAFWPTQKNPPWVSPETRAVLNIYNPSKGQWNNALQPLEGRIEIAHLTGDDIGWWAYYAPGSGIYMPLGRTIAVLNKLDYLVTVMKMSYDEIAKLPGWDVPDVANPNGNPNGIVFRHWQYMRNLLNGVTIRDIEDPNRTLTVDEHTSLAALLSFAIHGDNYLLNKFAMGTHDINKIIYDDAQRRGYNSVQFLSQPNPNGGWMAELFFIVDPSQPGVARTIESQLQLNDYSSCQVEYIETYPGFGLGNAKMLTCKNLPISQNKDKRSLINKASGALKSN